MLKEAVTFGPVGSVALQRHTLVVVADPQDAALLWTRCLRGAAGQDHPDLPPVHVQVPALPHVHVLSPRLKVRRAAGTDTSDTSAEGYVSVGQGERVLDLPVDRRVSPKVLLIER